MMMSEFHRPVNWQARWLLPTAPFWSIGSHFQEIKYPLPSAFPFFYLNILSGKKELLAFLADERLNFIAAQNESLGKHISDGILSSAVSANFAPVSDDPYEKIKVVRSSELKSVTVCGLSVLDRYSTIGLVFQIVSNDVVPRHVSAGA
jgi:hypothetical protein